MKYYKSNTFLKAISSTGFLSLVVCVLIAVGAVAWFALSRNVTSDKPLTDNEQSYNEPSTSYNDNTIVSEETPPATDANESVSDVPYTEEKPIVSQPEPSVQEIKFIMPIEGKLAKGYSDKTLQYSATYNDMRLHAGIDILCKIGSEIKSAGSGTVKSVVDDANYGKVVTIDHTGELTVKYCGFKEVKVKEGDNINTGDIIGISGEIPAECADEPHIHIEAFLQKSPTSPLEALNLE